MRAPKGGADPGPPVLQMLSTRPPPSCRSVRVNAVSPGPTRTEGTDAMGEGLEQLAAQGPAGRPATADEIAEAIVFLATDRASFIYGAKLAVDGGRTAI
jgi:NAD(P)-dependent dehydrogenase (short-subunit alcohol dehydrogenase family)